MTVSGWLLASYNRRNTCATGSARAGRCRSDWIPACAGMTVSGWLLASYNRRNTCATGSARAGRCRSDWIPACAGMTVSGWPIIRCSPGGRLEQAELLRYGQRAAGRWRTGLAWQPRGHQMAASLDSGLRRNDGKWQVVGRLEYLRGRRESGATESRGCWLGFRAGSAGPGAV